MCCLLVLAVHSMQGFLTFHVALVWFNVVPAELELKELVVWPGPGAKKLCVSRVVPCGSYSAACVQTLIWPKRGVTSGVVPLHVVPTVRYMRRLPFALSVRSRLVWFLCGSLWFLQRDTRGNMSLGSASPA